MFGLIRSGLRSMTAGAVGALARICLLSSCQALLARAASVIAAISSIRRIVAWSRKSEGCRSCFFTLMKRPSKTKGRRWSRR